MHVLYLIDSLQAGGGAEHSLAAMLPQLVRRGLRAEVAVLWNRPGLQRQIDEADALVVAVPAVRNRFGRVGRVRELLRGRRPDVVHTTLFESDIVGRTAAALVGVPVVSSLVNVAYGPEQFADPRLSSARLRACQALDAATARLAWRFHANASHVAAVMARRLALPEERLEVIPRGRDPIALGARTDERRAQVRARLGVSEGTPLLLAVGRQEYQKGLDTAVAGLPAVRGRFPEAVLMVAGREGNATGDLLASIDRLGLRTAVRRLGHRSDVADLLCAADVLVFPSRWEGLPGTLLEAMALETPIVASRLEGVKEAVGSSAVLVPPRDPDALSAAILEVLDDPVASRTRAQLGRQRFMERFTLEAVTVQMLGFYERALTSPPPLARVLRRPVAGRVRGGSPRTD